MPRRLLAASEVVLCGRSPATGHIAAILPACDPCFGYDGEPFPSQRPSIVLWYTVGNDGEEPRRLYRMRLYSMEAAIRPDRP